MYLVKKRLQHIILCNTKIEIKIKNSYWKNKEESK